MNDFQTETITKLNLLLPLLEKNGYEMKLSTEEELVQIRVTSDKKEKEELVVEIYEDSHADEFVAAVRSKLDDKTVQQEDRQETKQDMEETIPKV